MIILPSSAGIYRPFVSSGPTPPISANLARWYSANYGVTSSGGVVSQMDDLSGNGQHATQSTSGKRPSLVTNARKTNSMLSFDGVDDAVTFNGITLTGDFSIYWVGSIEETPGNSSGYFTQNDNGGLGNTNGVNNFQSGSYWYNNGADILAGNHGRVYQTSLDIVCIRRTGSTITCEINDLDDSTSPANANPTIGCIGHGFTGYSQMKFGEMLVYTAYHGTSDKTTVVNALKSTWKYPTLPVSGAALWLDGSRWDTLYTTDTGSTNVTTNGGAIGRWEDLSGNARHALQATSGSRPTWVSPNNGRIGLGAVNFNGSQHIFRAYDTDLGNALNFSGDFTIEAWVKFNSLPASNWSTFNTFGGTNQRWLFYYDTRSSQGTPGLRFTSINASNGINFDLKGAGTSGWSANTWYHVAVCRSGNNIRLFRDGVQNGSTLNTSTSLVSVTSGGFYVGSENLPSFGLLNGSVQNTIIYNGQALYTSNFTPFMSS